MKRDFDWTKAVKEILDTNNYCVIGTVDSKQGTWTNPVYYAHDNTYAFYFISMPKSRHMQNIAKDPRVTFAIYDSTQDTHGDVLGMQCEGTAQIVMDKKDVTHAIATYYGKVHAGDVKKITKKPEDFMGPKAEWVFVRMTLTGMHYFDTKVFGEERKSVPTEIWRSE